MLACFYCGDWPKVDKSPHPFQITSNTLTAEQWHRQLISFWYFMTHSFPWNVHMDKLNFQSVKVVKVIYHISLLKSSPMYKGFWPCVKNVNTWPSLQRSWRLCRLNIRLIWKTMQCSYASQPAIQAQIEDFFFFFSVKLQAGVRHGYSPLLLPL